MVHAGLRLSFGVATLLLSACTSNASESVKAQPATPTSPASSSSQTDAASLPKTVEEAVTYVIKRMSPEDQAKVRATPKDDLIRFHRTWGSGLRNDLGLWKGNDALFKATGAKHPDDASMVIIEAIWARLNETAPTTP